MACGLEWTTWTTWTWVGSMCGQNDKIPRPCKSRLSTQVHDQRDWRDQRERRRLWPPVAPVSPVTPVLLPPRKRRRQAARGGFQRREAEARRSREWRRGKSTLKAVKTPSGTLKSERFARFWETGWARSRLRRLGARPRRRPGERVPRPPTVPCPSPWRGFPRLAGLGSPPFRRDRKFWNST